MAKDFISDDEFAQLDKQGKVQAHQPEFISDDEMQGIDDHNQKGASLAALEHFGNAASLGYLPHLQAMAEKPMAKALDLITGNHVADSLPDYASRRDENIQRLSNQEKEFPHASLAGSIGGSIASGVGASALMPVEAASLPGRVAQAAKAGALVGAASNPGDVEGEVNPLQLKERGQNALISGALSAPLQLGSEAVGKVGGYLADKVGGFAEKKAFKALGPYQRNVLQNQDDINSIGRTLLDEGVIGKVPRSYETLAERAGAAKDASGQDIERIVNELSSKEGAPSLSRQEMANQLRQKLLADSNVPGVAAKNQKLSALIDEFAPGPSVGEISSSDSLPLKDARNLKQGVGDQIKWDRLPGADIPVEEEFHRGLYNQLKQGEEGIASDLAKAGKIPDGNNFLEAKKTYGNMAEAEDIASKRAAKEQANRFLGLTDTIAGGAGAGIGAYLGEQAGGHEGAKAGAAIGGGIGAFGNKLGRTYGNQVLATSGDALSKFLAQSPVLAQAVKNNPALAPVLLNTLKKDQMAQPEPTTLTPQILGRFKEHPELIDKLSNENLKAQIRHALERTPAGQPHEEPMSDDQIKQHFIQGN